MQELWRDCKLFLISQFLNVSWDIVLFNLRQKINNPSAVNEDLLVTTDFCKIFREHFKKIFKNDGHCAIVGKNY